MINSKVDAGVIQFSTDNIKRWLKNLNVSLGHRYTSFSASSIIIIVVTVVNVRVGIFDVPLWHFLRLDQS